MIFVLKKCEKKLTIHINDRCYSWGLNSREVINNTIKNIFTRKNKNKKQTGKGSWIKVNALEKKANQKTQKKNNKLFNSATEKVFEIELKIQTL